MPLYEYQCDACAHRFEVIQKFSDAPIAVCPSCGGAVRKLLSSPAIQFKGSGWYITDYARAGKNDGAKGGDKAEKPDKTAAAGAESTTSAKSESSSDSKSEPKGDTKSTPKPGSA